MPKYPETLLLYTDTDAFIYKFVGVDDIYEEIKKNIEYFDTSEFPKDNPYDIPLVNARMPKK